MKFIDSGNRDGKPVVLLHGGGLSWWSLQPVIALLGDTYHVITPVIDGHGGDGNTAFTSIEDSAEKLIRYIEENFRGKIFLLGGLSLGAQITLEALSRRPDIADYAVVESGLVLPLKAAAMTEWIFSLSYGLIKRRWFSKLQAKSLCVPPEQFEMYYKDSINMSKASLIRLSKSNAAYSLKNGVRYTAAKVLIIAGEKELGVMKKSAELLHEAIPGSTLYIAAGLKHGELSLRHSADYVELIRKHIGFGD